MEIASTCLRVLIFGIGYILTSIIFLNMELSIFVQSLNPQN